LKAFKALSSNHIKIVAASKDADHGTPSHNLKLKCKATLPSNRFARLSLQLNN